MLIMHAASFVPEMIGSSFNIPVSANIITAVNKALIRTAFPFDVRKIAAATSIISIITPASTYHPKKNILTVLSEQNAFNHVSPNAILFNEYPMPKSAAVLPNIVLATISSAENAITKIVMSVLGTFSFLPKY